MGNEASEDLAGSVIPQYSPTVIDVLTFIPEYVGDVTKDLQPHFGGQKFGTDGGWYLALMDMY